MARERKPRFSNPVAILVDRDCIARYGPWIEALLISLVDEGLSPILLSPMDVQLSARIPEPAMARLRYPRSRWGITRRLASGRLIDELDDEPVRLVLAMSGKLARYAIWIGRQIDAPVAALATSEDEVATVGRLAGRLICIFTAGKPLADRLRSRVGSSREGIVRDVSLGVHLGQRVAAFQEAERQRGIIGVGPLEPGNNFDQLIAAFAQLSDRGYDAVYCLIGSGRAERALRRMADDRKLADKLTFVNDISRLEEIFAGTDVYVQPYVCREMNLHLLSAMAAGVTVLARNGGALDLVQDGVNGVELTGGDESELTMVLQRLLDEPGIGRRIGSNAREFAQKNHLAGVTVQPLIETIKKVVLVQQTLRMPGTSPSRDSEGKPAEQDKDQ